jgi:predicted house-cleaning noncanonical NTP pyrophosphatase (MazG superfamily)
MIRIIHLQNQKNHYLEKFYSINENELLNFAKANFDNLESFYQMRDKILDIIKYIDQEIDLAQAKVEGVIDLSIRTQMREALAIKDEYVTRILAQDLEILTCIESAKSNIIRELQEIRRAKSVMGRYKSGAVGTRRLNEEA